jgi:pimeloyl-ACP methyl ester carboxylesterase
MGIVKVIVLVLALILLGLAGFLYKGEIPRDVVDAKYTSPASQFLDMTNGARVHFRDEGNPDGSVVVLVHGSNASLHTWEPWIRELGAGYRIVTMDLPGHGLTGGVPDNDYSSAAQLNTVSAVVTHLGIDQFVLGGNSMGGGVTWRYALQYPDQVEAMILVDASGLPAWRAERRAEQNGEEKEAPLAFKLLGQAWFRTIAKYIDPYYLVVQGIESSYNNSTVINQALIDRYYELSLRAGTRDATLARFGDRRNRDEIFDLSSLEQPTLVMWGREDSLIPVETADKFAQVLPNASVVIYDDVGHIPMEEIAERSAQDVLAFLGELSLSELSLDGIDIEDLELERL